ncbi:energy transducer TonB [Edaphocola aurantiacus]|uniref:energy transducer TonB n=1 Tax=Edaphocola aurantiacus TaxID=2601682 RepID=UPI001C963E2F|nr:energy transducer TonB [Edaphocola aurantiacus]
MNTHIPPATGYLDILFAHRNKQYGAYELRNNYNRRMIKAGLMAMTIVGLLALLAAKDKTDDAELTITGKSPVVTDTTVVQINEFDLPEKEIGKPIGHTGRTAKTADFAVPVIVKNQAADKPITQMPDKDALAGPVDNPGLANGTAIAMDNSLSDGPAGDLLSRKGDPKDTAVATGPVVMEDKVRDMADEMPEFPGGMQAWKKYLADNLRYPQAARVDEIEGTVYVNFVVAKDGSISRVKVARGIGGGCSEEAVRVLENAPRWKAGKQKGTAVNVKMTIPIRFAFR